MSTPSKSDPARERSSFNVNMPSDADYDDESDYVVVDDSRLAAVSHGMQQLGLGRPVRVESSYDVGLGSDTVISTLSSQWNGLSGHTWESVELVMSVTGTLQDLFTESTKNNFCVGTGIDAAHGPAIFKCGREVWGTFRPGNYDMLVRHVAVVGVNNTFGFPIAVTFTGVNAPDTHKVTSDSGVECHFIAMPTSGTESMRKCIISAVENPDSSEYMADFAGASHDEIMRSFPDFDSDGNQTSDTCRVPYSSPVVRLMERERGESLAHMVNSDNQVALHKEDQKRYAEMALARLRDVEHGLDPYAFGIRCQKASGTRVRSVDGDTVCDNIPLVDDIATGLASHQELLAKVRAGDYPLLSKSGLDEAAKTEIVNRSTVNAYMRHLDAMNAPRRLDVRLVMHVRPLAQKPDLGPYEAEWSDEE